MAQNAPHTPYAFDPEALVEFSFTNSDMADVVQHLARLTGWSVFYDPAQVRGKVTIVTPGKVPLAQAIRLVQGVTRPYGHLMQVLTPYHPHPIPFAALLATLTRPPEQRDAVVWRSSNARDPLARVCPCGPQGSNYPLLPFWVDVIVDQRRQ
jgi:hypothetical protein